MPMKVSCDGLKPEPSELELLESDPLDTESLEIGSILRFVPLFSLELTHGDFLLWMYHLLLSSFSGMLDGVGVVNRINRRALNAICFNAKSSIRSWCVWCSASSISSAGVL